MKKIFLLFAITCFMVEIGYTQPSNTEYQQALKLKNEYKFEESFTLFNRLLKSDSAKVDYLHNTAYLLCKLGNRQKTEEARQDYFRKAEYLSKKAVALDNASAEAHYTYALALARINEFASTKQKIANAKLIKTEAEAALKLNPRLGGAYHILGRWHRTIAGFNMLEKGMINTFYGGVPEGGSYDDAIEAFKKAVQYEPDYMLNKYELAQTYHERGNKDDNIYAKIWCKKVLEMTAKDSDDMNTQARAKALLEKIK